MLKSGLKKRQLVLEKLIVQINKDYDHIIVGAGIVGISLGLALLERSPSKKVLIIDKEVIVKDGRFGVYVTDGETNATLRRGDAVELLTLERALELLAGRRAWEIENPGGSKKKGKRAKKSAPTLTEKTVKGAGAKKRAKKAATGVGNAPK